MLYTILAVIISLVYIKYIESKSIFFPTREHGQTPDVVGLEYTDIALVTPEGIDLHGWFFPHDNAHQILLFLHGNGGNISHRLEKVRILHERNMAVFIFDYRGYGRSTGKPCEKGLYLDAETAYHYLIDELGVPPGEIIVYGESLGTAVAIQLAADHQIKALILEGVLSSVRDMAHKLYPFLPAVIFKDQFNSIKKISSAAAAKLFIHSRNDEIIPLRFARKVYDAASQPKVFVEIYGGHNTAFLDSRTHYIAAIDSFLATLPTKEE